MISAHEGRPHEGVRDGTPDLEAPDAFRQWSLRMIIVEALGCDPEIRTATNQFNRGPACKRRLCRIT